MINSIVEKVKKRRQRPPVYVSKKEQFVAGFFIQVPVIFSFFALLLTIISNNFSASDLEFVNGVKSISVELYLITATALFGFMILKGEVNVPMALASFYAVIMVTMVQVFKILPLEFDVPGKGDGDIKQSLIFGPLMALLISMLGVAWNLVRGIWNSLDNADEGATIENVAANQGPASKTGAVQPVPAASDLARDLRLSRSHARRHRGTRRY